MSHPAGSSKKPKLRGHSSSFSGVSPQVGEFRMASVQDDGLTIRGALPAGPQNIQDLHRLHTMEQRLSGAAWLAATVLCIVAVVAMGSSSFKATCQPRRGAAVSVLSLDLQTLIRDSTAPAPARDELLVHGDNEFGVTPLPTWPDLARATNRVMRYVRGALATSFYVAHEQRHPRLAANLLATSTSADDGVPDRAVVVTMTAADAKDQSVPASATIVQFLFLTSDDIPPPVLAEASSSSAVAAVDAQRTETIVRHVSQVKALEHCEDDYRSDAQFPSVDITGSVTRASILVSLQSPSPAAVAQANSSAASHAALAASDLRRKIRIRDVIVSYSRPSSEVVEGGRNKASARSADRVAGGDAAWVRRFRGYFDVTSSSTSAEGRRTIAPSKAVLRALASEITTVGFDNTEVPWSVTDIREVVKLASIRVSPASSVSAAPGSVGDDALAARGATIAVVYHASVGDFDLLGGKSSGLEGNTSWARAGRGSTQPQIGITLKYDTSLVAGAPATRAATRLERLGLVVLDKLAAELSAASVQNAAVAPTSATSLLAADPVLENAAAAWWQLALQSRFFTIL